MNLLTERKLPIAWITAFLLAMLVLLIIGLPRSFLGEHKITDGMKLDFDKASESQPTSSYTLTYYSETRLLALEGQIDFGVSFELERLLVEHPDIKGVILESDGGNIYQARGLARIIQVHALDTYVLKHCFSACTLAFLAGTGRFATKDSSIGFHGYRLEYNIGRTFINIEKEQQTDIEFYSKQIPDSDFVKQIFQHPLPELWIPEISELLESGVIHKIVDGI